MLPVSPWEFSISFNAVLILPLFVSIFVWGKCWPLKRLIFISYTVLTVHALLSQNVVQNLIFSHCFHISSPLIFLLFHPLTSDQRVGRWTERAFIVSAPFTDCSIWSGEDNGPVLVQHRARAWGDGVQCGQLLVLWIVGRESPSHLSLTLSGSLLSNRAAGWGRGRCICSAKRHWPVFPLSHYIAGWQGTPLTWP